MTLEGLNRRCFGHSSRSVHHRNLCIRVLPHVLREVELVGACIVRAAVTVTLNVGRER